MRRGGIYAGLATSLVLIGALVVTRPGVRASASSFFAPLPPPPTLSRDAGIALLPLEPVSLGAESPELAALRAGDAGVPPTRAPRHALVPGDADVAHAPPFRRPEGLRRPSFAGRDDDGTTAILGYLAHDEHAHGAFLAAIQRSGRVRSDVDRVLRAWKIPEDLAAVAFVESGFSPSTGADGGDGLWGLSSDVARAYGLVTQPTYDERRSVSVSSEGAAHYLADLRERFGSWDLALYAFGAGYGPALADLSARGQRDFWSLAPDLPADRVNYVREVLAVAIVLGNLDRFGFEDARADEALATSDLEVPAGASFGIVSRAAGTSMARLHELNPEYLGESVPSTGFAMVMHLPSSALARAKEMLIPLMYATPGSSLSRGGGYIRAPDAAAPLQTDQAVPRSHKGRFFYRIQEGDTLDSVASRFRADKQTITLDNALDPTAGLVAGQLLTIRPPAGADPPATSP
jgi:membrane-bound lytic murein transglycosylase D